MRARDGRAAMTARDGRAAMTTRGVIVLCLLAAACKGGKDGEGNAPPAAGPAPVPAKLHIAVDIDGKAAPPIDAATLAAHRPDYTQAEKQAWRLGPLLGPAYARPDAVLEVEGADGVKTVFTRPAQTIGGREPVLALNRRGEILVALMGADDPFPAFHGRGGNRGREGDPLQRIHDVVRLRLTVVAGGAAGKDEKRPAAGAEGVALAVTIDGKPPVTWTGADLARALPLEMTGEGGEGQREAWSLREVTRTLVGPGAAATKLTGEGGRSVTLDDKAWADAGRLPVLRINRRGQVKFQWVTPALVPIDGGDLRDVSAIDVKGGP